MKRILISQRVDVVGDRGERRDVLDHRWIAFLRTVGVLPLLAPNDRRTVLEILEVLPPDGILLTGGNTPVAYGGDAPERDEVDSLLLDYAEAHSIPTIGVCRGMQSIILHFGGTLKPVAGHVAVQHEVSGQVSRRVNSYHALAANALPPFLDVVARAEDDVVEAVRHVATPIFGMMWHPERQEEFCTEDVELFQRSWGTRRQDA